MRIVEAQKAKETADRSSYEARSGGRWKLLKKPRQVLFADQKCEYCDVPVKYPLSGWNPNVMIAGYSDLTQSYDADRGQDDQLNYTHRHHCNTSDPILDKKIEALRKEFKAYQERAFEFFKHQPSL